jgi:phage protein U
MTSLIAVGGAILRVIGLNPQKIGARSESRVPAKPTFSGMDYQLTGLGEERIRLEFATVPLVMGGLDTLEILRGIHRDQTIVPYLRLGAAYAATLQGLVVVQSLDTDEDRIHPFTGVGRLVHGEAEMILVGDASSPSVGLTIGTGLVSALRGSFA